MCQLDKGHPERYVEVDVENVDVDGKCCEEPEERRSVDAWRGTLLIENILVRFTVKFQSSYSNCLRPQSAELSK